MQIAFIKWIDAVSAGDEWVQETEGTCEVITVGILHKVTDDYTTIVLSLTDDGMIRGYMSIPNSCIVYKEVKNVNSGSN